MRMKNFLLRKLFLNVFLFVPVYRSSQHYSRHANTSFTIENEKQNRMSILDYRLSMTIKHLPLLSTVNLSVLGFMHILTASYHLTKSLVLRTHSLIDTSKYAQVGLNLR